MRVILPFFLFCIICSACYKANNTPVTGPPVFKIYTSSGGSVTDSTVTINIIDSNWLSLSLAFKLVSGNPEDFPIKCSLTNLPTGTTCAETTFTFKLNYSVNFDLDVMSDTGYYTLGVQIATNNGTKTYPIVLHVLPPYDAAPRIIGTYYGSDPCGFHSFGSQWYSYTASIATVPGYPHWITIKNFRGIGDNAYVSAKVEGLGIYTSLSIPVQTVNGYTISGNGSSTEDVSPNGNNKPAINFRDTLIHGGDTQMCITQLRQHKW